MSSDKRTKRPTSTRGPASRAAARARDEVGREVRRAATEVEREVRRAAADVKRDAREAARDVQRDAMEAAREARRAASDAARDARHSAADDDPRRPIWLRPQPGTRRPRFSRDEIAAAALAIADQDGIEAVSMRRVAAELGAGTMSLYYYVRSKDELLTLMHDAMIGEILVPEGRLPSDWREALTAIAAGSLAAFVRHPWSIEAPAIAPGPNAMRHVDQSLEAVAGLDIDLRTRLEIITMVDDYLVGFVLRAVQDERELQAYGENYLDSIAEYFSDQLATGDYPNIERAIAGLPVREVIAEFDELSRDEGRFERGLARLLDGIAQSLGLD